MADPATTGLTIRRAVPDDAGRLSEVHVRTWQIAYAGLIPQAVLDSLDIVARAARWRTTLESTSRPGAGARGRTWVALEGDDLVGFSSSGPAREEQAPWPLELWALYVHPRRHGTDAGRLLADAAIGDLPAFLWVLDGNDRAIRFYEKIGFAFDGATKDERHGGVMLHERRMVRGI
ncbi:GNAT family N-acetyltransferase [Microbacterium marinilacus]|uniref:GNAT family N-acetyltransferase n=1 Tax=Microbacterium marinilacus TaxID=415209 RepID=A0ABP7BC44_9MICO|nr:GNAT family N-acetyltransferase [Microbacterium marinilacus]MBY0690210.1 GNAT family N-acetyltransferase [Microbacterium marinilacus]